jgi:predicted dithiol-disulfide oxidoreductase (DUF899 family)
MDYTESLNSLIKEEIALRDHIERVAAMRRALPPGPIVKDYTYKEGPADLSRNDPKDFKDVKLSELFEPDKDELIVYHMMYGPDWEGACPMCSMWVVGLNGIAHYVGERANIVVIAKAGIDKLRKWAKERGLHRIRFLSSHDSTFNLDMGVEDKDGNQSPAVSVFVRDKDGIRHQFMKFAPLDKDTNRGLDLISPVWNLYDLLPSGRGDWEPSDGWWGFLERYSD